MTEQEFSALFDADEKALLEDLGDTLRATPALDLPTDFARQTAQNVEQRFRSLPALSRLAVRVEPVLGASVASPRAFPYALGLLGGTVFGGVMGQQAIADLGLGLMGLVLLWKLLSWICLPVTGRKPSRDWPWLDFAFYLLPLASALVTAVVCGALVSALMFFSIHFKTASWDGMLFGPLAGLAIFLYLMSALPKSWRALHRQCVGRPGWLFPVQLLHAGWVGLPCSLLLSLADPKVSHLYLWVPLLSLAVIVSLRLGSRATLEGDGRPAVRRALGKTIRSLVIGGLPIGAILVVAYEASLTRQIEQPLAYENALNEVRGWVREQEAVPPLENGWTELRVAMTYRGQSAPELLTQMRAGGWIYEPEDDPHFLDTPENKEKYRKAHPEFLKALPLIRSAVSKPYFSYVSTESFKFQSLVPNFLVARSVTQGLAGLTVEAVDARQSEQALNYQLLNLSWSSKLRTGSLISLMVGIAQESIALGPVERWVFECHPDKQQLRRLLAGLQASEFGRQDLQAAMRREVYLADLAFTELEANDSKALESLNDSGPAWVSLARLVPRSYWKSEHRAYVNLMLANQDGLFQLGRPSDIDPGDLLPFSFAARQLAPATTKAQANFMLIMTRYEALKTVVALELYQRDHGAYPESLQALVPAYLPELPKNVASTNLWDRKPILEYVRGGDSYQLVAESPVFETFRVKSRQVFGPQGPHKLLYLNR